MLPIQDRPLLRIEDDVVVLYARYPRRAGHPRASRAYRPALASASPVAGLPATAAPTGPAVAS